MSLTLLLSFDGYSDHHQGNTLIVETHKAIAWYELVLMRTGLTIVM